MGVRRELAVGPAGGRKSPQLLRGGCRDTSRFQCFCAVTHNRSSQKGVPKPFGQDALLWVAGPLGQATEDGAETL